MENLPTLSEVVLQDMPIEFFDFTFIINSDGTMKECQFLWKKVDEQLAISLWTIREKYMKKTRQHKEDKKKLANQQAEREAWAKNRDHLQEHIRKSEAKLSEYKNVILAFWKLATCNSISK